jgi:hypothetical protein
MSPQSDIAHSPNDISQRWCANNRAVHFNRLSRDAMAIAGWSAREPFKEAKRWWSFAVLQPCISKYCGNEAIHSNDNI